MPRSFLFAAVAVALTALTPAAHAGGAEEIMRLCSQPDSQMSGGQVAFCHGFWQGVADALKHPATPVSTMKSTATPSMAPRPGEVPLNQGSSREISLDQGSTGEVPLH